MRPLRSFVLFVVLGLMSLGVVAATPSKADAFFYYSPYGAYYNPYYWNRGYYLNPYSYGTYYNRYYPFTNRYYYYYNNYPFWW